MQRTVKRYDYSKFADVTLDEDLNGQFVKHSDYDQLRRENERLREALDHVWEVASGEVQVAMDDTQGMEYLSDYVSSVCTHDADADDAALAVSEPSQKEEA